MYMYIDINTSNISCKKIRDINIEGDLFIKKYEK